MYSQAFKNLIEELNNYCKGNEFQSDESTIMYLRLLKIYLPKEFKNFSSQKKQMALAKKENKK